MQRTLEFPRRSSASVAPIDPAVSGQSILASEGYDNAIRWQAGLRLHHLFERRASEFVREGHVAHAALDVDGTAISFAELDQRANQMARYFASEGVTGGDRVGLIVDRSIESYVALLAVLKLDAAYVPLDVKFPTDRIAFIAGDAGIKAFVTTSSARKLVVELGMPVIELGDAARESATLPRTPLEFDAAMPRADALCYIIYTSGSTGRPKGVAVNHSSICNFVQVATEVYGYQPGDRVYQGMTLAFDFSVEELWVPLIAGATLVPAPADRQMVGAELAAFLKQKQITAMCCVPTLLATIDEDLPALRLLLVSGEACPQDIVARWQRPGRRMLNAYGPTEATVTATWTEVVPDKAVTIGVPLPTYTIAILDTARDALAGDGAVGEIAIAGVGLAVGYVNRDDLTSKAFVPDFLQLANNPSRRLYRTGDLGRINADGEIEYLGRIDTQVKIRGYRIELAEIENVLLEVDGVAQAVVTTYEGEPGIVDLAAYFTCFEAGPRPSRERLLKVLRSRLPGYMVPAYVEELDEMPLLASHKADRKALPPPSGLRLVSSSGTFAAPRNEIERVVADCLAQTMKLDAVSIDDHFFDDLGAHSLLMGQFLTALNKELTSAKAAISDVYLAPSVALLSAELSARGAMAGVAEDVAVPMDERTDETAHVASDFDYIRCGVLQAAFYVVQYAFFMGVLTGGVTWVAGAVDEVQIATRAIAFSAFSLVLTMAIPVLAKWLIIGRWKAERIPIWSVRYFKFWVVLQLTRFSPWLAFRGTTLFNLYLRLLGAQVGPGALLLATRVPLATDLLWIGARTVMRKGAHFAGYRAENGYIHIGGIDIGADVTVGEMSVLDLDTSIGDGGQLGHASALLSGQTIEAGRRYHGSPAEETDTSFNHLPHRDTSWMQRNVFAAARFVAVVMSSALMLALVLIAGLWFGGGDGTEGRAVADQLGQALTLGGLMAVFVLSLVVFVIGYAVALLLHVIVPRVMRLMLEPGKEYPLYGARYYAATLLKAFGFVPNFQMLLGDSSAIVRYFKWLGVRLPDVQQTGSNFGLSMAFDSPMDIEIGTGSMVSDGLSIVNYEIGSGSFRVAPAQIGANTFVGNAMVLPPGARIGDNVLLGTKVMIPTDGRVRENVGLLGSPAFEIPRGVVNGRQFNPVPSTVDERAKLMAKNWFNLRTALLYLGSQWSLLFGLMVIGWLAVSLYPSLGVAGAVLGAMAAAMFVLAHDVFAERFSLRGIELKAHSCTIHEPYYWWVERHWKLGETLLKYAFTGTPFRLALLRLVGLKVGRKVFDDGCIVTEKPLVEIGDNCCLNVGGTIQGHSLEDGLFKSDRIVIGAGSTVGSVAFVHYGVQMGEGTVVAADSFLMKGSATEPGSRWQGNPARVI